MTIPAQIEPITLKLKKDQKPFFCGPPKQVEYFFESPAQKHLQELLDNKIIKRVTGYTPYCSEAKCIHKPKGGVRMVINYIHLNKNIQRRGEPFQATEYIQKKIAKNSQCFWSADF